MERMGAGDSWFLYAEGPTQHLHVTGVLLLDPGTSPEPFGFDRVHRLVSLRVHLMEGFRQRIVPVPLGIDHPARHDDPDFDLAHHLVHVTLDPADPYALRRFVGEFCAEQLDRTKPLWQMAYLDGLEDGRVCLVTKIHHALVDGITGVDIMADLLDLSPDAPLEREGHPEAPLRDRDRAAATAGDGPGPEAGSAAMGEAPGLPGPLDAAIGALQGRLADPLRPLRAAWRTGTSVVGAAAATVEHRLRGDPSAAGPFAAPKAPFNSALSPRRSVAFGDVSLAEVKAAARTFGVKVNDVVLAACAAGLRADLAAQGVLPDRPLVVSVPVSVHGKGGDDAITNQVSSMFVHLPVEVEDPVERLMAVHDSAAEAKEVQAILGPRLIGDIVDLVWPPLFAAMMRTWSSSGLADRLPPVHNLIVSNVRGTPMPLYFGGAELVGLFPFGPLMEGAGLNLTVLSHGDRMDVGLLACPDLVADVDHLLAEVLAGFDELAKLARDAGGDTTG
jgi:WS/DGAT/MGAT family acyltransferase